MGEHKCVVSYCCCGCSLRSGSLAIGIAVLIISLINSIYNIIQAIRFGGVDGWVGFVTNLLVVIVCCFLIQGIRQERRGYVMAWVVTMAVIIVINLIFAIILIVSLNFIVGFITLVLMGVFIYLVVVVRSYGLTLGSSPGVA